MKTRLITSLGFALALSAMLPLAGQGLVTPVVSVVKGEKHFKTGYDPINVDGTINAIIEIPAGTTAKIETLDNGTMELEQKDGAPRFVKYLGYPANYGLVPRSVLLKSKGGDGDPLDVIVLGPALPTGTIVKCRPIGVLTLVDNGELDDKIILAPVNSVFGSIKGIEELDKKFPGVTGILQTWFTSYKGYGKDGKLQLSSKGFKSRSAAIKVIGDAVLDYEMSVSTDADRRALDEKGNPFLYRWPGAKNKGE
ncbi:MAG: inorganic diphosphatase [Holophagaceae bacterium]|uniref:inorganic diphosphatase n=1 Tax=Candidatus Geothrix skivensis TaxID=2954439 RepID=A0A9D7XGI4_9BACT|nr:inorganic diphosphatase [Candidatus Geothrix skivensis]